MSTEEKIRLKIQNQLNPLFLHIMNESAAHKGSRGSETHFRLEIVSDHFLGQKTLERHRIVQKILKDELLLIKAFSLHTFTPKEWDEKKQKMEKSPSCRGSHGT